MHAMSCVSAGDRYFLIFFSRNKHTQEFAPGAHDFLKEPHICFLRFTRLLNTYSHAFSRSQAANRRVGLLARSSASVEGAWTVVALGWARGFSLGG